MNTLDSTQMCPDCGYVWKMKQLDLGEQYRVFCPKHDLHVARYCDGRPMLDDSCPQCVIDTLRKENERLIAELEEAHKYIVKFHDNRPDHACRECMPGDKALMGDFICGFHKAKQALNNK